jgi:hypothetical protein
MTEAEILAEITIYTTLIQQAPKIGQRYEIGTGQSRRIFENVDLKTAIEHRSSLYRDLSNLQDGGGGVLCGF